MKESKNTKTVVENQNIDLSRRKLGAAALAVTAAGIFYGLSKSGISLINEAEAGDKKMACWGINSCKGTTDCNTAFNACNGENSCKGKGFKNVASAEECKKKGGVPLKGSEGDPKKS